MRGLFFWMGEYRISTDRENAAAFIDLCYRHGVVYGTPRWEADGGVSLSVPLQSARRLRLLCRSSGVEVRFWGHAGLPYLLWRYRKRLGLAFGALFGVFLLVLSTRFVWDVRIGGNDSVESAEILAVLRENGLFVGSYIPTLHTARVETDTLIASDRLSWVSIRLDGTVAVVQVLEHVAPPPAEPVKPANLIAGTDGQIEMIEVYRGNCMVKVGQAVRAGELLVSGLYDSNRLGYRYTRASGRITARTERVLRVEIPLLEEQKHYGDAECAELRLNFFDFSLKIFKKGGNRTPLYDIIKEEKPVVLFDRYRLPVGFSVTLERPYVLRVVSLSAEEALDRAYAGLEQQLSALSGVVQLLKKDLRCEMTDDALILTCTVECLENIALQQEFEISE